ncbi:MAG: sodium:glutamate symporter [Synergistaceae bacterium]|nr:sodium:glutamate symporter [Synergistaceae bacterium]
MTVYSLLTDFCYASILILIGMLIRSKLKVVQKSFIPASLLAGFLGLALGPTMLKIIPFSGEIGNYAGVLTIFVFASVGMNGFSFSAKDMKTELERMGSHALYKIIALSLQMSLPIFFTSLFLVNIAPNISDGFGLILAAGFFGGHGTAAAVGETFAGLGWPQATDLAMTSATIGILAGVFGGLFFIRLATKKGYTQYVDDFSRIPDDLRTGLIRPGSRRSLASETISSIALDPIAFHLALLLVPSGIGYVINQYITKYTGLNLPTFTVAFIISLILFVLLGKGEKGIYKYVDSNLITRLGSAATDYLVFFGVASIKIAVVLEYLVPFTLLMLFGCVIVVVNLMYFGPRMNKNSWFERSIFVYGYSTGVFSIGMTLLRIVDPDNRSRTLTDTAIVGPLVTPLEMFAWAAGPAMLVSGKAFTLAGIFLAITVAAIAASFLFKWWYASVPLAGRDSVEDVLSEN